jgi:hypothetical protein
MSFPPASAMSQPDRCHGVGVAIDDAGVRQDAHVGRQQGGALGTQALEAVGLRLVGIVLGLMRNEIAEDPHFAGRRAHSQIDDARVEVGMGVDDRAASAG